MRRFLVVLGCMVGVGALVAAVPGNDTGPAGGGKPGMLHERFAASGSPEIPDFRRHVVPMLGRMGCNSRACHGSFQGQGGFRLSLFGYDFKADHEALTAGEKPRVALQKPLESLVLEHPTDEDHGGGKRFAQGSWQYNVLRRWIEGGAKGTVLHAFELTRLEVEPKQMLFTHAGQKARLRATAVWSDGAREEVTDICRFRTNDEALVEVNEEGQVTAHDPGDTHVVVFYDNQVVPIPVLQPVSDRVGANYPQMAARTQVDALIQQKLRTLGIIPSGVADDAQFLRRVSLDVTGTLPGPEEIRAFLADRSPDRRARKIDALLHTPAYASWWATRFCDWTGNAAEQIAEPIQGFRNQESQEWYKWIEKRLAENRPYDEIVAGMLLAVGRSRPNESYRDYCLEMSSYLRSDHPADFTQRATMPFYWTRRNMQKPEDRAIAVSYAFLGVRLQCAQCHKHPFDQWTQQDFQQFEAFFTPLRAGVRPGEGAERQKIAAELGVDRNKVSQKELYDKAFQKVRAGEAIPWSELWVADAKTAAATNKFGSKNGKGGKGLGKFNVVADPSITPKPLGAAELPAGKYADPRAGLMEWMRRRDNPYFAQAIVNRVWAAYFGRGIVDPPDDMNLANPPSNRPLLDYLAAGFVEHHYDLVWLHRTILNTDAYQRTWEPNATNRLDERNFSRMIPRRLPAEVVFDAVAQALAAPQRIATARSDMTGRAIAGAGLGDFRNGGALASFGKPARQTTCDCERTNDPTLLQTVLLRNDPLLQTKIDASPWLRQAGLDLTPKPTPGKGRNAGKRVGTSGIATAANTVQPVAALATISPRMEALIQETFLRTVSRLPKPDEIRAARETVASAASPAGGVRDLLWTMINTKEFVVNH